MVAEAQGGMHRVAVINPYSPARTELIGTNAKQATSADVGKAVKLAGVSTELCASGNEIYGFIESVEVASKNGVSVGGVLSDQGSEVYATDQAGTLTVGALVVAGTITAFGTALPTTGPNVIAGTPTTHKWLVMARYTSGAYSGGVLLRKI